MCKQTIRKVVALGSAFLILALPALGRADTPAKTSQYVLSWQRDNPVLTGIASAITLSAWPERFGDDAITTSPTHPQGVPIAAHDVLLSKSALTFHVARYAGYATLGLCLALWGWRCTRRRRNRKQVSGISQFSA